MARDYETALVLRGFGGLDQSKDRTLISYSDSPDCVNMSTEGGSLRTARGYRRIDAPNVPGGVKSMGAFYRRSDGREWILCANSGGIYAWSGDTGGQNQSAWEQIYVPESGKMGEMVDFLNYQDKENDVVLMADGVNPVLTWSGSGESQAREGITQRFAHIEMNYERVWGAGAPGEPDTVYWSRQFDVGDWTGDVNDPDNGGGFLQAPTWNGGKIRLISALFGDIVIFKDQDVLKVSGTYPGEYQVSRVTGTEGPVAARTVCQWGDKVYFLGRTGLCFYDGMRAQDAGDRRARKWYERISESYIEKACAIVHGHTMYIALPVDGSEENNCVLEYDMNRDTIMPRTGINAAHWLEWNGKLLFAGSSGVIYEYGQGTTYDGRPINAYWETPTYNMGSSKLTGDRTTKQLGELTVYGKGRMHILARADEKRKQSEIIMHTYDKRTRKRLNLRGRRFSLRLSSVDGVSFELYGSVTIGMDVESD